MNTAAHTAKRPRLMLAALLLAGLFAATLFIATPVSAQNGGLGPDSRVLFDDNAGAYHIVVTQLPREPVVGTLRVVVEPTNAETGEIVENALVRVFGTPQEEGERQYSPALNSPTDRSMYFAQIEVEHSGAWVIDVEIDGALGRELVIAETSVRGRARSGGNTAIGSALFALVSGGFVGGSLWLWYSSKKARARRDAARMRGHGPSTTG